MECIRLYLGSKEEYDRGVHGSKQPGGLPVLAEMGDLKIATLDDATVTKKPGAVLYFTVRLPDGTKAQAQAVTTVGLLATLAAALRGRYGLGGPEAHRFGGNNPFL